MNIQFIINVHSFVKAAGIEESLKAQGITYSIKVDDKPSLGAGRKKIRSRIGKDEVAAVMLCVGTHPTWTWPQISKATGVGASTVGRIKNGTHPLQQNSGGNHDSSIHQG